MALSFINSFLGRYNSFNGFLSESAGITFAAAGFSRFPGKMFCDGMICNIRYLQLANFIKDSLKDTPERHTIHRNQKNNMFCWHKIHVPMS